MLEDLVCPYCGSLLKKQSLPETTPSAFGVVVCKCDEYPVLENIIFLLKDDNFTNKETVLLIKKNKYLRAIWNCLYPASKKYRLIVICVYIAKKYFGINIPLKILLKIFANIGPSKDWFQYLLGRERRYDYKFAVKLFTKTRVNKPCVIVDIGSGIGHFERSNPIKQNLADLKCFSLEKSFLSLFIAVIYTKHNNIIRICCNVETGIPLRSHFVTDVLFVDCISWIYNKKRILQETYRILKKNCRLYLLNINPKCFFHAYGIDASVLYIILQKFFTKIRFYLETADQSKIVRTVKLEDIQDKPYTCIVSKK